MRQPRLRQSLLPAPERRTQANMIMILRCVFLVAILLFSCGAELTAQSTAVQPFPVRLALQWLPQSQFAGAYMARERGFYREEGLEVTLIHTGPGPSSLDFLAAGKADFATMFLADAIVTTGKPLQLISVAQLFQRSNLLLLAWRDAGIEKPADLDGRPVSYWQSAFSVAFDVFFEQHGIHPQVLPQHYSVNLFLHRGVVACSAMLYNEYHRIYQAGIDYEQLTVFRMSDYGLDFPEDGIYTTAAMAARHPEICRALRRATLAGWDYARRHPEEVIDIVLRESRNGNVPANRPHTRWTLQQVLESIFPPETGRRPGRLERKAYEQTLQTLIATRRVAAGPSYEDFAPFEKDQP
ncbi:MAG: ABC transporter substrate-binding protein [Deltaproteobacteria bacterium]|nr:ABC transporter substrate-binding protein [Deltaproteobacteria bacterium]